MAPKLSMFLTVKTAPLAAEPPTAVPRSAPSVVGNSRILLIIAFIVVTTSILAFPTFIILACGMPPALAAAFVDNRPGRHVSYCIMAANLAGIAPALVALWLGGNSIASAMMLMGDVYVWLGMYGAAAIGWVLIWLYTQIAKFALEVMTRFRIRRLLSDQKNIGHEWGEAVAGH